MISWEKIQRIRELIEKAAISLDDEEALEVPDFYPFWDPDDVLYTVGMRVRYEGILYRCLQAHTSQSDWSPTTAGSLWAKVLIPDPDVVPVWEQPDSTNPYPKGAKVYFPTKNDPIYISIIDNNVWAPDVYGWELYSD